MKNIIIGSMSFIALLLSIMIIYTNFNRSSRDAELSRAIDYAMDFTMETIKEENEYSPSSNDEMYALFVQTLFSQISSSSNITVTSLYEDYEKGIFYVEVISEYNHINGRKGYITKTKLSILDGVQSDEMYTSYNVVYMSEDGVYKSYSVKEGELLPIPIEPSLNGKIFIGWINVNTGDSISNSTIVTSDMLIKAVFEE